MSYALQRVAEELIQITLPRPGLPLPYGAPINLHLVNDPTAPALVGVGLPLTLPALREALAHLGLSPERIVRVVALDWSPDQLGAIDAFPNAELFLGAPDMTTPRRYGRLIAQERDALIARVDQLLEDPEYAALMDRGELERVLGGYFADLPEQLDFVPLRSGHPLQLGDRRLRVVEAPGPWRGHIALHDPEDGVLLSGRLVTRPRWGEPWIRQLSTLLLSLERVQELKPRLLLPAQGLPDRDASWAIRRQHRFMTGLLSNIPVVLAQTPTIPALICRDLGHRPPHLIRFVETVRRYQAYLEELIRTGVVFRSGEGVWTSYGTESVEPRLISER
ncbi:MAG: hypothetical protein CMH57_00715 [Myxococcales bacterium]|nr:hypothetical protein [Myxococcales bacterium]